MTGFKSHARALFASRLFGAWSGSMTARSLALVPLAIIALDREAAVSSSVHAYIAGFAFVTASSYLWNSVYEYRHLGHPPSKTGSCGLRAGIATTIVFIPYILFVNSENLSEILALLGAVLLQPATALLRVTCIAGMHYKVGYLATAFRDGPAALVAIAWIANPVAINFLPESFAIGALFQYVALRTKVARKKALTPRQVPIRRGAFFAGSSALALAAYQPFSRMLAGASDNPSAMTVYDLADKPAYMLALVVAGGVATELQRRWQISPLSQARKELQIASLATTGFMSIASLPLAAISFLSPPHSLLAPETFLPVALTALLANAAYLWSALRTRLLMGIDAPQLVTAAYACGLLVMTIGWLVINLTTTPGAMHIAALSAAGFSTAAYIQSLHPDIRGAV